jgi:2,4-dienoyl-CoA reductase-like NADH-dependent reductase (Old Yellow Enzyme family)
MAHLGGISSRGPGLLCIEATAVTANGRITPQDSGLWEDAQIAPLKRIVDFAHSQNQKVMIQLAHAGRKASMVAPWLSAAGLATKELGGWPDDVWAPSAIAFDENYPKPKEMTKENIETFKQAFVAGVKRSLEVGVDAIEIHNAHGYLLHSFLSGVSNTRTDEYGGSFENRTRLTLEVVDLVRKNIPEDMPLFLRISATDWLESSDSEVASRSWTSEQNVKLSKILAERGVDLLDISSGGNHPDQKIKFDGLPANHGKAYQSPLSFDVKKAVGDKLLVSTVGSITTAPVAESLLQDGLDLIVIGRAFQKNPGLVFTFADELEVTARMPSQIRWGFYGRGS